MKHSLNILLLLLFITLTLHSQEMLSRTRMLMGTYVTLTLPAEHNKQISEAFGLIAFLEHSLSTFDENAILATLNRTHETVQDPALAEALQFSKRYYRETEGYFDVTIGSITKTLYRFGEADPSSPSKEALKGVRLNIDGIHLDGASIHSDADIIIDLGGMGKGYTVDKVASWLHSQNISEGTIALSGDIRCLSQCELYLQSPFSEGVFAKVQSKVPDLSISTSGTYRRYAAKKEEHHLIDPKTASQGRAFVSVSLFTRTDNARIDAYATALSIMPKEKALRFLKEHKEIGFILVEKDGKILYGNTDRLLKIEWLPYRETETIHNNTKKRETNPPIETSLIHPDTTHPKEINR